MTELLAKLKRDLMGMLDYPIKAEISSGRLRFTHNDSGSELLIKPERGIFGNSYNVLTSTGIFKHYGVAPILDRILKGADDRPN